ncbi:hypothetical protein [Curtobacterium sp. MCSS17_016]|uniref:hypothetical protein n=1 Tax=Curtobacterium sp. MCSS17_016 TaxID=2175644 RepID=UPI000DA98DC5|nr:hypothetical protein [Curtobacterium sp. MCSS17_016]WIE81536.1 hypothetical protein DEJ19_020065 [Curtobacterium sp. MCSS17_016]
MTLADDPNTPEALQQRITELEHNIAMTRRAKATAAARAAHPDVWAIVLSPPEGIEEVFTGMPTDDQAWLRDRAEELASKPGEPTNRLLLTDGTAADDAERAAAIVALFPDGYFTDTVDEVLPGVPTADVLATLGWPALTTVTDEEAAHDRDAVADERSYDTYAGARESLADALTATLSLARTPGEDEDLVAAERELEALRTTLRTTTGLGVTNQVLELFPAATNYTVGYAGTDVVLVAVGTSKGRVFYIEDDPDEAPMLAVGSSVDLDGEDIDLSAEWFSPLTGERITHGTTVVVEDVYPRVGDAATLDELTARGQVSRRWARHLGSRWHSLVDTRLAGGARSWWESDVTTFMGLGMGVFNKAMTNHLCAVVNISPSENTGLLSGSRYAHLTEGKRLGGRSIDVVIANFDDADESWKAVAAVEAKFGAMVHGDQDYCADKHHGLYSNQIICYPAGCTHDDLYAPKEGSVGGIPFVWLSDMTSTDVSDARNAILPTEVAKWPHLETPMKLQQEASKLWTTTTWTTLRSAVAHDLTTAGFDQPVVTALTRALENR